MATSNYGTVKPSDVDNTDIDIFYTFTTTRDESPTEVLKLDSSNISPLTFTPNDLANTERKLGGLYNLSLPRNLFNTKGIYNVYIRPKEIVTEILDCGVLSAIPSIKGIVLDSTRPEVSSLTEKFTNGGLTGYRIEYLDNNNKKIPNTYRVVTSANRAEAVSQNVNNSSDKSIRYRFLNNGSLVFLTVSPSSSSSIKPNTRPFIGEPQQKIIITNTFFDPVHLEIELTDVTLDTVGDILLGNQATNINKGTYTIFDRDTNDIAHQFSIFTVKDETNNNRFEIRQKRDNIDFNENFDEIITFNEDN